MIFSIHGGRGNAQPSEWKNPPRHGEAIPYRPKTGEWPPLVQSANPCEGGACRAPAAVGHIELAIARALLCRIEPHIERATGEGRKRRSAGVGGDCVVVGSPRNSETGKIHRNRTHVRN